MAEHKRCPTCHGRGKVLQEYDDWKGKPCAKDVTCPECNGKGYIEKTKSGSDIIVHPK